MWAEVTQNGKDFETLVEICP